MQPDARIEDVVHDNTLGDPVEFVRGIVGNFHHSHEKFNLDEAVVRIGTSGKGVHPHYCVEEGEGELATTLTLPSGATTTIRSYRKRAVFHGLSHKQILDDQAKGISWSSSVATFAEVQSILGRLRASKRSASRPRGL